MYMKNETCIHIETAYKKKKVKVNLRFSEETNDKNAQYFYDHLKKIYMEKEEFRAMIPGAPELKSMTPSHLGGQGHGR